MRLKRKMRKKKQRMLKRKMRKRRKRRLKRKRSTMDLS